MTDLRDLISRMADELDYYRQLLTDDRREVHALAVEARAALAAEADGPAVPEGREPASVVGEPSDEEIMELMTQQMHDDLAAAVRAMAEQEGIDSTRAKGVMRIMLNRHVVDLARAVLARYGHQPAPPAAGEVGELVADELVRRLRTKAATEKSNRCHYSAILLTRAADLLEQRHPAPVPVSERLPGPEDCDAEGRCWWWYPPVPEQNYGYWIYEDNAVPERSRLEWPESWLPATALPLPAPSSPATGTTHETESND